MIYVAQMETEHFSFTALGRSESGALGALGEGWMTHLRQYRADDDAMSPEEAIEYYGAAVFRLAAGECARDHEPLQTGER